MHTRRTFLVVVAEVMYPLKLKIHCRTHVTADDSRVNVSSSNLVLRRGQRDETLTI